MLCEALKDEDASIDAVKKPIVHNNFKAFGLEVIAEKGISCLRDQ